MTDPFRNLRYDLDKSQSLPHTMSDYGKSTYSLSNSRSTLSEDINSDKGKKSFIQAHVDANRELITQLRNNIELIFKGSK